MKLTFTLEKSTKNTHRYQEVTEEEPYIGALYLQRKSFKREDDPPYEIAVEITGRGLIRKKD